MTTTTLKARALADEIRKNRASKEGPYLPKQELTKPLNQYQSLAETFRPQDAGSLLQEAKTRSMVGKSVVETRMSQTESRQKDWVKTGYELYIKYRLGVA